MPGEVIPPADTPSSLSGAWRYMQPLSAWFSMVVGGGCRSDTGGVATILRGEREPLAGRLAGWFVGWLAGLLG